MSNYGRFHRHGDNTKATPWAIFNVYNLRFGPFCWMNPPFTGLYFWMKKAFQASQEDNCTTVCFVPAWTDDRWFHELCPKAAEIIFLRDRVHFHNADGSQPDGGFPISMMIVVFKPGNHTPKFSFVHHAMKDL
jgi:hypothetical protein